MVRETLSSLGLFFEQEACIGPWSVDFLVFPDEVIEVDGNYWHTSPEQRTRDARKTTWLTERGFEVLRLPEDEIRSGVALDLIRQRWTKFATEHSQDPGPDGLA